MIENLMVGVGLVPLVATKGEAFRRAILYVI